MSVRITFFLAMLWLGQGVEAQLYFPGGDVLSGELRVLDTGKGTLRWDYPEVSEPFEFQTSSLSHLLFKEAEVGSKLPGTFRITLTQGDVVQGEIVGIEENTMTVDVGFEEPLLIEKSIIHRIDRDWDRSRLLYAGPTAEGEWEVGFRGTNWKFDEQAAALRCSSYSSTGRLFKEWPDKARFEMQLSLENEPILHLFLGADNPRNGGEDYYYLKLTPNAIDFERRIKDHPRSYVSLPREDVSPKGERLFRGKKELHVAIEMDRSAKRLKLFLDGELYASYRDPAPKAPIGSSIVLTSYGSGALSARALRLYALDRLTEIRREVPEGNALLDDRDTLAVETLTLHQISGLLAANFQPLSPLDDQKPSVTLKTGSRLRGELLVEGGRMILEAPLLGRCVLPVDDVLRIDFPVGPAPAVTGRVLFKNGDQLAGQPHAWTKDEGLLWRWSGGDASLRFPPRSLAEIHLVPKEADTEPSVTLQLIGGDLLPGNLMSMTPETLVLETNFSEPMTLSVPVLKKMEFAQVEHLYASGPEGPLSRWTRNGEQADWDLDEHGVLVGQGLGGIGQAIPMPERGRLDLDISWKGFLDASFTLFAKNLSRAVQPSSYRFHCERERITLYRGLTAEEVERDQVDEEPLRNLRLEEQLERFSAQFGGGASRKLGSPVAVDFDKHERIRRVSVCWDNATGEISLVLDGTTLRTWKDSAGLVTPSAGLILQQHKQNTTLRLHRYVVEEWNGVLPEPSMTLQEGRELKGTLLRLRNQDEFAASILGLTGPKAPLQLGSELGLIKIPLDRLRWIQYPHRKYPVDPIEGMVLSADLASGGFCRFYLEKLENGRLQVRSPYFGENSLSLEAMKTLRFDLRDFEYWRDR